MTKYTATYGRMLLDKLKATLDELDITVTTGQEYIQDSIGEPNATRIAIRFEVKGEQKDDIPDIPPEDVFRGALVHLKGQPVSFMMPREQTWPKGIDHETIIEGNIVVHILERFDDLEAFFFSKGIYDAQFGFVLAEWA